MVSMPNSISQQTQSHQSDSTFQLALASSSNNFTAIRDGTKVTIVKPTIQQQQLQQNLNKIQGIVFANTIELPQAQLQAKLQRQSTQTNASNTHPLTMRTIPRKIQLTQAPPSTIVLQGEKLSDASHSHSYFNAYCLGACLHR